MTASTQKYLRRADAASYVRTTWGIPCSSRWLAKLAVTGGGRSTERPDASPSMRPTILIPGRNGVSELRAARPRCRCRSMHRHAHNPRAAKTHRCYDVAQLVKLYDCHRNTISNWVEAGLRSIDDKYPRLFHGSTLKAFHSERRKKRKRPCGPGQVYCLVCQTPKGPLGGMVDYQPNSISTEQLLPSAPTATASSTV